MAGYTKTITLGIDYSGFTGGINQCNQKLKLLDAQFQSANQTIKENGNILDAAGVKQEYLANKIEIQKAKVEAAKDKYEALMNAHADTSKIDAAQAAFLREKTALSELEEEAKLGGASIEELTGVMAASVATIAAVTSAWTECTVAVAGYVDDVQTMAQQTGASTQTVQVWQTMADSVDVSADTMAKAMTKMKSNMDKAQSGSGEAAKAFQNLGVSVTDGSKHLRNAESVMWDVMDALKEIPNETERDAAAMAIFGKSADELAGYIDIGSAGFQELKNHAIELGAIMSEDEVAAVDQFNKALDDMNIKTQGVQKQMAAMFAPVLTVLVDLFNSIPTPVLAVGAAIVSVAAVMIAGAVGIVAFSSALTTIGPAAMQAAAGLVPLVAEAAPFIALGAAIAVVVVAIVELVNAVDRAGGIAQVFRNMSNSVMSFVNSCKAIQGVIGAVKGAIDGIIQFFTKLKKKIDEIIEAIHNLWSAITGGATASAGAVSSVGMNSIGHNASGTQNWRGGLTWVGENGPELVSLPQGSRIYNNTDSRNMATTNHITMNVDISRLKSVNDVVSAVQGIGMSMGGM